MRIASRLAMSCLAIGLVGTLGACTTSDQDNQKTVVSETGATGSGGTDGVSAYEAGDYKRAEQIFTTKNQGSGGNPYTQFNLADTYLAQGRRDDAIGLYRQVAVTGRGVVPSKLYEPHKDGATLQDAACDHLRALSVSDQNCPA